MQKTCIVVGVTLFGWIGWALGEHVGMMTAFLLSSVGSILGVYVGWRVNRDFLSY